MNNGIERYYGLDILKVIAMFMVLILHILNASETLILSAENQNYYLAHFIDISAYCAVDIFAIITGFCGVTKDVNFKQLVKVWVNVFFYTTFITIIYSLATGTINSLMCFRALFPILSDGYRYFTQYFVCFFFTPYFNKLLNIITKRNVRSLFILIITFFSFYALLNVGSNTGGYHVLWLCILYVLGGCIKKGKIFSSVKRWMCVCLYCLFVIITFLSKFINENYNNSLINTITAGNSDFLISYTSPTILFSAIFLVVLFSKIEVKHELIKNIFSSFAKTNFSVFIIHAHYLVWGRVLGATITKYSRWFLHASNLNFVISIASISICIYLVCTCIDMYRLALFKVCNVDKICTKFILNVEKVSNKVTEKKTI